MKKFNSHKNQEIHVPNSLFEAWETSCNICPGNKLGVARIYVLLENEWYQEGNSCSKMTLVANLVVFVRVISTKMVAMEPA